MPWEIARIDDVIAHSGADEFKDDKVTVFMSIGAGPMYIEWRSKTIQPKVNLQAISEIVYTFRITSDPIYPNIEVLCLLESISHEDDHFVYKFIPLARSMAQRRRTVAKESVRYITDLEDILKSEIGINDFIVASEIRNNKYFDGFAIDGTFMDFFSTFCYKNGIEYTVDDVSVVLGKIKIKASEPYEIELTNNFLVMSNIYGVNVFLLVSPYQPVPLGYPIRYKAIDGRLIAFKYEYGPDKERTHFYVTNTKAHISDFHLNLIFGDVNLPAPSYVDVGVVTKYVDGTPYGMFNSNYMGPAMKRPIFDGGVKVTKMYTFATDKMGELFPERSGNAVFLFDSNFRGAGVYAGDIYADSDEIPKRDSPEDYRLTLKNATVYITGDGAYIISANDKVYVAGNAGGDHNKTGTALAPSTLPVARKDDPTISDNSTDASFWTWMSNFKTAFNSWTPVPGDGGASLKAFISSLVIPSWPTKQEGKIKEGSSNVEAN